MGDSIAPNRSGSRRFGEFEFDCNPRKLLRDGEPVRIQPQPLRVLEALVERPGEIISREELRTRIWGDATFVEFDQGLNYCIRQIRLALRDNALNPMYVETLPKQGYRLIAAVTPDVRAANAAPMETLAPEPMVADFAASAALAAPAPAARTHSNWLLPALVCCIFALLAGVVLALRLRTPAPQISYTQLTDFTDSAIAPVLSPDGHMVAYTVVDSGGWATYTVSVLGGDSHLLLNNAAGLTWLGHDKVLFSELHSGVHMGVVSGTITRGDVQELYFPAHERAMAHYSYASPDRKSVLAVEMDKNGKWASCRLISMDRRSHSRPIGPDGACTSAGWSPDGAWMYFTAVVKGQSHLWRQHFPDGQPQQITSGPTEEEGVAVEQDGHSVITSMGVHESAIWIHDAEGDRCLSSEGDVLRGSSPPIFSADNQILYYLLRHSSTVSGPELWRMMLNSGKSEALLPGIAMLAFDISRDGKQVVYSAAGGGKSSLWLAPLDRSSAPKQIGHSGETSPHFGTRGQILFQLTEGKFNYLEQMNPDGGARSKVVPYPILDIQGVSPGGHWVMAGVPLPDRAGGVPMAVPVEGGPPRRICEAYCLPAWSSNGKFLFVPVEAASRTSPGRSLAIPVGRGESLPEFPADGISPQAEASVMPGAQSVNRANLVPGKDPFHFAYVNTTVHRNLYRISLP
jgi:DNA-binding winged helix-turn-helix (wHTH) protein/Tol biopolymer transport system component